MTCLSILIPAHNESAYISACLGHLYASDRLPDGVEVEVLVLANGCTDDTAHKARLLEPPLGWQLHVLERGEGGKLAALNDGDKAARGDILIYLDADVEVEPDLLPQLVDALSVEQPLYATGTPVVSRAQSAYSRAYSRVWQKLPFVTTGAPGFGLFAMTRAGRARWGDWPAIISDDTFARLSFSPAERLRLPAKYHWPMVEGFRNLVRVRRRQNIGVAEIARLYPALPGNDDAKRLTGSDLIRLALQHPFGFCAYVAVNLAVKTPLFSSKDRWARGR